MDDERAILGILKAKIYALRYLKRNEPYFQNLLSWSVNLFSKIISIIFQ